MAVTCPVSVLVDRITQQLEGVAYTEVNLLGSDLSDSTANAIDTFTLVNGIGGAVPGVHVTIDDEDLLVTGNTDATGIVQVLRGQSDSAAVSHDVNAVVLVDPPWPRATIMTTLQDELRSWGPQVFSVQAIEIPTVLSQLGYDCPINGAYRVLAVRETAPPYIGDSYSGFGGVTPVTPSDEWPTVPYDIIWNGDPTSFPSGIGLVLRTWDFSFPANLRVEYAMPFDVDTAWTDTTDLVADVGLDPSDLDIPVFGVAWRLLAFRTPRRLMTQAQGQERDDNAVPALALMAAAQQFMTMRNSRLNDAQARILQKYGVEMDVAW